MEDKPVFKYLLRASMVGIHLVAATFVGFVIGYYLDKWLGTSPWMTFIFLAIGIYTGFRDLFRLTMFQEPDAKKEALLKKKDKDGA